MTNSFMSIELSLDFLFVYFVHFEDPSIVIDFVLSLLLQLWQKFKGGEKPPAFLGSSKEYNVDMVPKVFRLDFGSSRPLMLHTFLWLWHNNGQVLHVLLTLYRNLFRGEQRCIFRRCRKI